MTTLLLLATLHAGLQSAGDPAQILGTWRGTSVCTDRVAVPGCNDETASYEFTPGSRTGSVHWEAAKIVNGQRQSMGETDAAFDPSDGCWKAQVPSPRSPGLTAAWRLCVDGAHMTGEARSGNRVFRKLDLRREQSTGAPMYGLIGKMTAVKGERDALAKILVDGTGTMPGCLSYIVAADPADADALWITEVWDGKASHDASLSLPAVQAAIAKGRPLIAGFSNQVETVPLGGYGLKK